MCVALMTSGTAGRVEVAQDLHASRMIELLWPRLTARLRRVA
jgi:hypothetical protein